MSGNPYVVYDTSILTEFFGDITASIGVAIPIGIRCACCVMGVLLVVHLIKSL